jgi:hypothetical protein
MTRNSTKGQVVWVSVGHGFCDYCNVGVVIRKQCHPYVLQRAVAPCLDVNVRSVLLHFYSHNLLKHPTDLWCSL